MEIGYVVSELWRLKRWVALGLIVGVLAAIAVLYELPSFESKSYEVGAASTEVLVEPSDAPLGSLGTDLNTRTSLVAQAELYVRLLRTAPVKEPMARMAGIPVGSIATSAPPTNVEAGREVPSEQRANELLVEDNTYRILPKAAPEVPVIVISTQGPSAEKAVRLADAAVGALREYVSDTAAEAGIPRETRFRQLGPAEGGTITQNASIKLAGMAFFGTFVAWALLVLVVARLRAGWRAAQAAERLEPEAVGHDEALSTSVPEEVATLTARSASSRRATG